MHHILVVNSYPDPPFQNPVSAPGCSCFTNAELYDMHTCTMSALVHFIKFEKEKDVVANCLFPDVY